MELSKIHVKDVFDFEFFPLAVLDLNYRFMYRYNFPIETHWHLGSIDYVTIVKHSYDRSKTLLAFAYSHIPQESNDVMKQLLDKL